MEQAPIHLTILRRGDTHIVDLAEVGSLIPRSETQVDSGFLDDLTSEIMRLATPGYGTRDVGATLGALSLPTLTTAKEDLQRIGGLIFSHLLTEPARKRLRSAAPCDLYLRLDEHLIHIPWELCHDGEDFLATKFRVGRQVITGAQIPEPMEERKVKDVLKVLLIADPTESLPEANSEAEQLCSLLDTIPKVEVTLLGGKQVRKVPLLGALQGHDVVHFAGHSHYDPENPSKSGWRLHEGVLTAGELSKLHHSPLLVFSNSCQAGATAEWANGYRYEGQAFGIGSAFLLAGVRNYIGAFWVVHDEESVLFATTFYQNIVAGLSLGEALLSARHEVLQHKGWNGLTWASYMLYGDPTFTLLSATKGQLSSSLSSGAEQTIRGEQIPVHTEKLQASGQGRQRVLRWSLSQLSRRQLLILGSIAVSSLLPGYFLFLRASLPVSKGEKDKAVAQIDQGGSVSRKKSSIPSPGAEERQPKGVGVMHFKALSLDPQLEWMRDAIRDSFNSHLSNAAGLKVYSKEYIDFLVQKGSVTEIEVAERLGIAKMISGSFLAVANKLRIEAHIVDVQSGVLEKSVHVEGVQSDFFNLHQQLAVQIMACLNIAPPPSTEVVQGTPSSPSSPSLDTYKLLLEAEGETAATTPVQEGGDPVSRNAPWRTDKALAFFGFTLGWTEASTAWAQEGPQTGRSAEEEIRQVLERYRQAYETKDLALLDSVYDTLAPAQREANAKYFQQTQDLRVTIRNVDIAVSGDEAAVSYTREDLFVDARTGQNAKLAVRFTKFLVRMDNAWKLASGKKEQWAPVKE